MFYGYGWKRPRKRKASNTGNNFPSKRFIRVTAAILSPEMGEVRGRVFLTDLTSSGVSIFTEHPLQKGDTVAVVIDKPQLLYVKGEVSWCVIHTLNTRVISPENYRYRVHVRFTFDSRQEEDQVKIFCSELPN